MNIPNNVRTDLNGMTKDEVKRYFNQCIAEGKVFVYSGGVTGGPIVRRSSDRDFIRGTEVIVIGCTGGVEQALYFNELMTEYLKSRENRSNSGNSENRSHPQ